MPYRLLDEFEALFRGTKYKHRDSTLGDHVALHLYEDLLALHKSTKFDQRVGTREWVVNTANRRQGVRARRGDGTFGEIIPGETATTAPSFVVSRGIVATVEIGVEVKILAKAMIKQIDRVIGDLQKQVDHFRRGGGNPICVGIVGINHAPFCVSYEGSRTYKTDGKSNRHPVQEANEAANRLIAEAAPRFTEFVLLKYIATNDPPFAFSWLDPVVTQRDYSSSLLRILRDYDQRP